MVVNVEIEADLKTPLYTPVVKRRLDTSALLDPLKRVDPARTVYTPPSTPPSSRRKAQNEPDGGGRG
jgi:hypothetical protein